MRRYNRPSQPGLEDFWRGAARWVIDPSFRPPPELRRHAETSTVRFGDRYLMYYRTFVDAPHPERMAIGLAISDDGDRWTAHNGGRAVLPWGAPGSVDHFGLYAPSVVVRGDELYMVYEGWPAQRERQVIAAARSSDGIHWTRLGTVLTANAANGWEDTNVGTPSLTWANDRWYVFYHGYTGGSGPDTLARGFASGTSLTALTRHGPPVLTSSVGPWASVGIGRGDLLREGEYWYMVFEGLVGSPLCESVTRLSWTVARSRDLTHWQPWPRSPVARNPNPGCGQDMPAWQRIGDRRLVVTTRPDADGVQRYKLVPTDRVAIAASPDGQGYWIATARGEVYNFGSADHYGAVVGTSLRAPIVAIAATRTGRGYWLAAADGGVFAFGDAAFAGPRAALSLRAPVVGIAADPDGRGYWLAAADGGVFAFDAQFRGSAGDRTLAAPIVGIAADPRGRGYWLVARDGGVFSYGPDFHGSAGGMQLNAPVSAMAAAPDGRGYWLVAQDGGVFTFGSARFHGSAADRMLTEPVRGMVPRPDGAGYWLVAGDGGVFALDAMFYGAAVP